MGRLRSYIEPPYRAEEWFFVSQFETSADLQFAGVVPINGNAAVPNGYRGVIAVAGCYSKPTEPQFSTVDLIATNIRWTLWVNDQVVPGFLNRLSNGLDMFYDVFVNEQLIAGVILTGFDTGKISGMAFEQRILVPVKLKAGDRLRFAINAAAGGAPDVPVRVGFLHLQGWIYPGVDENESGAGNLNDPV